MKRNFTKALIIAVLACVMSVFAFADTYEPNNDGLYQFTLNLEPNSEYVLFAVKGEYDQTNYIEAFSEAKDSDIIYYEQKTAGDDGLVTFGPFAPKGYYNATLIVTGTGLTEPYFAGHLSAGGVLNEARIDIVGLRDKYNIYGEYGQDLFIDIETKLYDSFGYESFSMQTPYISLVGAKDGVELLENGRLFIDKSASEQLFGVVASVGDTKNVKYVELTRDNARIYEIKIFDKADCSIPVSEIQVAGTAGEYPSVTLYAKSYNQFGEEMEDTHSFVFDGKTATSTVRPTRDGTFDFVVTGNTSGTVTQTLKINVLSYGENSLALYNLIKECGEELSLLGSEKFVCDENGESVFAPYTWTTSGNKTAFEEALANAKTALEAYNETNDAEFADDVTMLKNAYNTYVSSFKTGSRTDVTSIAFESEEYLFPVATDWNSIKMITVPRIALTTDKITYTSSDTSIAEVDGQGRVRAKGNGTVTITATTRSGLAATCRVSSYRKVSRIDFDKSRYVADYSLDNIKVDAQIKPNAQTNYYGDTIVWSLENPALAELVVEKTAAGEAATVIPKQSGKTNIVVTAVNSGITKKAELTVVMPAWDKAAKPVASASGNVVKNTHVTLTSDTPDVTIYYTLDGTTPSAENGRVYKSPIVVSQDLVLRAVAVKEGMFDSDVVTYEYNALETAVTVTDAVARAGESVKVNVSLADFADVKSANIEITYDSASLVLVNAEFAQGVMITEGADTQAGKYVIEVSMAGGQSFDGKAVTLEFDTAATADDGDYSVVVSRAEVVDVRDEPRNTKTKNGTVTIRDYILGDANDDGKIGLEDVLIIKQYAAGNVNAQKNIFFVAADVNGDGIVDVNDSKLIANYCVGLIESFN